MTDKVEAKTSEENKTSYAHLIMQKRKAALEHAAKAYEQAVKNRINELGKLCLECNLGDHDTGFLREQFLKISASPPKSPQTRQSEAVKKEAVKNEK
jgi:hypothetical protein